MQVSTSTLLGSAALLHTWILSNPLLTLFQMFHSRSLLTAEDLPLIVSWHLPPLAPSRPPPTLITDTCFFSMCHSGHCTLPLCPPYQESRQAKPETSDYITLIQSETVSFMFTLCKTALKLRFVLDTSINKQWLAKLTHRWRVLGSQHGVLVCSLLWSKDGC